MKKTKENLQVTSYNISPLGVGLILAAGILIGAKVQRRIDIKLLKGVTVMAKDTAPLFPNVKTIAELKDVVSKIDGAVMKDALVYTVEGITRLAVE